MKYVLYDYEEPYADPDPRNFWHIYSNDEADHDVFDETTLLYIYGPRTPEMGDAIVKICEAIDAAVDLAMTHRRSVEEVE
jgi:hypothetical protein